MDRKKANKAGLQRTIEKFITGVKANRGRKRRPFKGETEGTHARRTYRYTLAVTHAHVGRKAYIRPLLTVKTQEPWDREHTLNYSVFYVLKGLVFLHSGSEV